MSDTEELRGSIVAIYDIVGYSTGGATTQAHQVKNFIDKVERKLDAIGGLKPSAFSTGDGAIISIGDGCVINKETTKKFIDLIIDCAVELEQEGLKITTSVNYAERDQIIPIEDSDYIQGDFIQVGDTINQAARLEGFCSPSEIIFSRSVYEQLLNKWGLAVLEDEDRPNGNEDKYVLHPNEDIVVKHNQKLISYTYVPSGELEEIYLYSPNNVSHKYKKYSYFPSIDTHIVEDFKQQRMGTELENIIQEKYESLWDLKNNQSVISQRRVLDLLQTVRYDHEDDVYILSREDRSDNFWNQPAREAYIEYLENIAESHGGVINQTRVRVYNKETEHEWLDEYDIRRELEPLHEPNSYFSYPSQPLSAYEELNKLSFGFTLSTKYKYAIIPLPSPELDKLDGTRPPDLSRIGERVQYYENSGVEGRSIPMKAIITFDDDYVDNLIEEMNKLLDDPALKTIK